MVVLSNAYWKTMSDAITIYMGIYTADICHIWEYIQLIYAISIDIYTADIRHIYGVIYTADFSGNECIYTYISD